MKQLTLNFQNDMEPSGGMRTLSLPEGSRNCASRSASRANARVRPTTATSGPQCSELFGLFDPDGSWAKTFTALLIGRKGWFSTRCALTWKTKVTKSGRMYFRLVPSMLPTAEIEFGLLPTVQTQGLKQCRNGRTVFMPMHLLPTVQKSDGGRGPAKLTNGKSIRKSGEAFNPQLTDLAAAGLLLTPTVSCRKMGTAKDRKDGTPRTSELNHLVARSVGRNSQLNPRYVAEMMGFPLDWTELPFLSGDENRSKPTVTQ